MKLQAKKVLVTGAGKRVGRLIAKAFANKGAKVFIHYHQSEAEAKSLAEEISGKIYQADLCKMDETKKMALQILREQEGVDVIVHNASLFYPTPLREVTEKHWDDFTNIHLKAPFFLAQILAPAMQKKGEGRLIHISDWSALRPYENFIPYCCSKAGLITLTQALAKALAPQVLVNAIAPGPIIPPPHFDEKEKQKVLQKTLVQHWGDPEEIAKTAVFLAESDFITGQCYKVDGGASLQSP